MLRALSGRHVAAIHVLGRCTSAAAAVAAAARSSSTAARHPSFRAADLEVSPECTPGRPAQLPEELPFGRVFTPHMLLVHYTAAEGWGRPRIVPFGPLALHPASQVLHYGMCCFEGMKAYMGEDGRGRLFRPEMNMQRLLRSARRLLLAEFDPQELLGCVSALLRLDRAWVPRGPGQSMYIRPFAWGSDGSLGVAASSSTSLAVILSPVGDYFGGGGGATAVRLLLDSENVRAWPGGPGAFKVGGNYAPTVSPQAAAMAAHRCSQVIYTLPQGPDPLDALVSECGAMNAFFCLEAPPPPPPSAAAAGPGGAGAGAGVGAGGSPGGQAPSPGGGGAVRPRMEVVTPPLDGTILPGVTRDSILQLLREERPDVLVSERQLTVRELAEAHQGGRLREAFGCGTACVVQPVRCVVTSDGAEWELPPPAGEGSVAGWVRRRLLDIQYGRGGPHPWSVPFE